MAHKFTGEVVIHCHILYHEDLGMMMTADIVEEGEVLFKFRIWKCNGVPLINPYFPTSTTSLIKQLHVLYHIGMNKKS